MHEIEVGQSELHIDDNTPLTVYVPNNAESQECCFKCDLPHRLASWLMTDPITGAQGKIEGSIVNVINSVLNCLISTTERILEKEGIPQVPEIPEILETFAPIMEVERPAENTTMAVAPNLGAQDERLPQTPTRSQENETYSSPDSVLSPLATPWSPADRESAPDQFTPMSDPEDYDSEDSPGTPNSDGLIRPPPPQFLIPAQQPLSQYQRLLEGVVALARRTTLPNKTEDMSTVFQGLTVEDDPFEGLSYVYASHEWEHRKRIGAAGELFVRNSLDSALLHF